MEQGHYYCTDVKQSSGSVRKWKKQSNVHHMLLCWAHPDSPAAGSVGGTPSLSPGVAQGWRKLLLQKWCPYAMTDQKPTPLTLNRGHSEGPSGSRAPCGAGWGLSCDCMIVRIPPSGQSCFPLSLADVGPECTPQQTSCQKITISESISIEPTCYRYHLWQGRGKAEEGGSKRFPFTDLLDFAETISRRTCKNLKYWLTLERRTGWWGTWRKKRLSMILPFTVFEICIMTVC